MAIILEEIYEVALHRYNMKLVAGGRGLRNLVDWVHAVEEMDYVSFLKGRELIVTTGIKEKDEEMLECFVKSLYEAGASGLVINVGKYITRVPHSVITYSEEVGFPIFVLPWKVHLVDFNRDLCNLIYKTMQEQDSLETALQKAIFSEKLLTKREDGTLFFRVPSLFSQDSYMTQSMVLGKQLSYHCYTVVRSHGS